eukprot:7652932-Ditylum_brightwellii.AAC.1
MMHAPRHISAHNWIARLIKQKNYLTEFPTPPGVAQRKLDWEMDNRGINVSSSIIKEFTKMHSMEEYDSTMSGTKVACTVNVRVDPMMTRSSSKALNTTINKKITKAFSHQEKKKKAELKKFEVFSILSGSNAGDSNDSSKVSHTSDKGLGSK